MIQVFVIRNDSSFNKTFDCEFFIHPCEFVLFTMIQSINTHASPMM